MGSQRKVRPATSSRAGDLRTHTHPGSAFALAGVVPARSKGQNFLTQAAVARRIVEAAGLCPGDEVVEIGPGTGILTGCILDHGVARLVLVELDRALAARLRTAFANDPRVSVIEADFVAADLPATLKRPPAIIIGNLPFNAAAAILRKLCGHHRMVSRMVLMFQREVGERVRARPGEPAYSALSVYTALYFDVDLHFRVAAGSFHPRPRVDAEVLRFRPCPARLFAPAEENCVLETIRASFSAPRKTIRNSLAHGLGIDTADAVSVLERAGIDPGVRAESLSPADFVTLSRSIVRAQTGDAHGSG